MTDLLDYKITDSLDSRYSVPIKLLLRTLLKALIMNIINLPGSNSTIFKLIIFNSPRIPKLFTT